MSLAQVLSGRLLLTRILIGSSAVSTRLSQGQIAFYSSPAAEEERQGEATDKTTKKRNPEKDRSQIIPVETSIRYLQSEAYKETYGDTPIWVPYRRNFKGQFAPKRTRKMCIRQEEISTGNPCPICRDEYLVLHYRNVELLKQFISPHNGEILGTEKTGLCRRQHFNLLVEMEKAKDLGTITFDVPFRDYGNYDYRKVLENMDEEDVESTTDEEAQRSQNVK